MNLSNLVSQAFNVKKADDLGEIRETIKILSSPIGAKDTIGDRILPSLKSIGPDPYIYRKDFKSFQSEVKPPQDLIALGVSEDLRLIADTMLRHVYKNYTDKTKAIQGLNFMAKKIPTLYSIPDLDDFL